MFAKQTIWSASLVALCCAAPLARAEGDVPPQSDDEVRPPGETEPTPVEKDDAHWLAPFDPPVPATPPEIKENPVEPKPPPATPPDQPRKPTGRFMIGAGYSSIEGFIATASISQDDLFRTGNHLSLHTTISARRQLFLLRFADPDLFGSKLALSTDLYNDSRLLPGFRRNAAGGSLTLSHPIGENLRAFVGYRLEEVEIDDKETVFARLVDGGAMSPTGGTLSALRTGIVYTTLDQPNAPMRGTSIGASIEIADRKLGSDLQFNKYQAWANTHQPLGPFTLHLGGRMTALTGRHGGGVPMSEGLFLDGTHEVRGYRPETFGPIGPNGMPLGGDLKLVGGAELELPLSKRLGLSAVGFAEAGAIAAGGRGAIGRSVGVGLLWRSPIGPLRFDWVKPLDGGAPGFLFGIGSGCCGSAF